MPKKKNFQYSLARKRNFEAKRNYIINMQCKHMSDSQINTYIKTKLSFPSEIRKQ